VVVGVTNKGLKMEKLYNDKGQVAVAVSYGYGAGWSTWNNVNPMDKDFNELILAKDWDKAEELAEERGEYGGGLRDCKIVWLDKGIRFKITEYDGSENIEFAEQDWNIA